MNTMGQRISESVIKCHHFISSIFCTALCYSCWIKSDDGAIAAFIAPIVVIMLVCITVKITANSQHLNFFADKLHIFGHFSKSIMATQNKDKQTTFL